MNEKKRIHMPKKAEQSLEKTIFNSRWLLAPFYLGLIIGIILLFIKFFQKIWYITTHVFTASEADVIVGTLVLIDIALVASLLLIIVFSGYEIFVSKIDTGDHEDRPGWMGTIDFSGLKLKKKVQPSKYFNSQFSVQKTEKTRREVKKKINDAKKCDNNDRQKLLLF